MSRPVIIDTDPGIDDALALLLALQSPEVHPVCICSVCGNLPVATATENIFRILELQPPLHPPVVARGAEKPLEKEPCHATFLHGSDGLGDSQASHTAGGTCASKANELLSPRDGAGEILHQIRSLADPAFLVSLGPLTNVALALEREPETMASLESLTVMGGAVAAPGNITPAAEFNFFFDPLAARKVLSSGLDITLVGLDVTRKVRLGPGDLQGIPDNPRTRFISSITSSLFNHMQQTQGRADIPLHDPLAVAMSCCPVLCRTRNLHLQVEAGSGLGEGMSLADRRPLLPHLLPEPNVRVCEEVDKEEMEKLFAERLLWAPYS